MDEEELEIITDVFGKYMDVDEDTEDGFLPSDSLGDAMAALGVDMKHERAVLGALDPHSTGRIDFEPFAEIMTIQLKDRSNTDAEELFRLFTNTDRITLQDLERISQSAVKDNPTYDQLMEMLSLGKSKTFIDLDDFTKLMKEANGL